MGGSLVGGMEYNYRKHCRLTLNQKLSRGTDPTSCIILAFKTSRMKGFFLLILSLITGKNISAASLMILKMDDLVRNNKIIVIAAVGYMICFFNCLTE